MTDNTINETIGAIWDKKSGRGKTASGNWWSCPRVYAHIGKKISGSFSDFIKSETQGRKFRRAISVGCGSGAKELKLVEAGIVERFELYELSKERVLAGQKTAAARGLSGAMHFHLGDAFKECVTPAAYDLVHWNNSLHHMLDTRSALAWSKNVLTDDGVLVMDDFVGPSRFQWSDLNLRVASALRASLPSRLMLRGDGIKPLSTKVARKTVAHMIELDPSEAADSSNIIPSLKDLFAGAKIVLTGGALYHLGLSGVYANLRMDNEEDVRILDMALLMDDLMIGLGESHYAVAIARKNSYV
jgi:SAM-dependent methyltransferase